MPYQFMRMFILPLLFAALPAQAALQIDIVGGAANQIPVSIVPFGGEAAMPQQISRIVNADLQRSGMFKMIDPAGIVPAPVEPTDVRFADWQARGADAMAIGKIIAQPNGKLEVHFRLLDVVRQMQLAGVSYVVSPSQLRATAHKIADVIYEKLTGDIGVFSTRIAYVMKLSGRYELQVADADGEGAQTVVASAEPIISPAWAPDGQRLAYVSFERKKPVIFVQNVDTGQRYVLANFKGSNSAPAWSPDGSKLAIALTRDGDTQIYTIGAQGGPATRLMSSSGIDTEPFWSPDGQWIYFTSDRGGSPQIYRLPAGGGAAQRLTFDGAYNVSPQVTPDGSQMVFVHREGGDHVAIMDLASRQVQVLSDTKEDESPSFAPNGKIILYATQLGGRGVLAAVSADGRVKQRLASKAGDVREPAWGPLPKAGGQ